MSTNEARLHHLANDWEALTAHGGNISKPVKDCLKQCVKELRATLAAQPQETAPAAFDARAFASKLRDILTKPVDNWVADGQTVRHSTDLSELIRDHSAHPQSLSLIADALNFTVRRLALLNLVSELDAAVQAAAPTELTELREQVAFLKEELKAVETKTGIENVFEQGKAQGHTEAAPATAQLSDRVQRFHEELLDHLEQKCGADSSIEEEVGVVKQMLRLFIETNGRQPAPASAEGESKWDTAQSATSSVAGIATDSTKCTGTSDAHTWRTIICGLPIIRKLLAGEDVTLETFNVNLIPDDVLFNAKPAAPDASTAAKGEPSEGDKVWTVQLSDRDVAVILYAETGSRNKAKEITELLNWLLRSYATDAEAKSSCARPSGTSAGEEGK